MTEQSAAFDKKEEPGIFTDSHAHLLQVERRLGQETLAALFSAYSRVWAAAPGGGAGKGAAAGASAEGVDAAISRKKCQAPFIVDIGLEAGDLRFRIERFGNYPFVFFTAGLWPGREAFENSDAALQALRRDIASPRCSALGECGLDYHHMEAPRAAQIKLFEAQASMAAEAGLPLIVHSREAFEDTLAVAATISGETSVVIHCFGYGAAEAEKFLRQGCALSFAGNITYKNAEILRGALAVAPADRLLLETDAPYMNPAPRRGRDSTPLDIERTLKEAAHIKRMEPAELAAAAHANASKIFCRRSPPA